MTLEQVADNIRANKYKAVYITPPPKMPEHHVEDPEKSVNWNRQYVADWNKRRADTVQQNRKAENEAAALFGTELRGALVTEFRLTEKQAVIVMSKAYDSGHAYGYDQVLIDARDLAEFWKDMRAAETEGEAK